MSSSISSFKYPSPSPSVSFVSVGHWIFILTRMIHDDWPRWSSESSKFDSSDYRSINQNKYHIFLCGDPSPFFVIIIFCSTHFHIFFLFHLFIPSSICLYMYLILKDGFRCSCLIKRIFAFCFSLSFFLFFFSSSFFL